MLASTLRRTSWLAARNLTASFLSHTPKPTSVVVSPFSTPASHLYGVFESHRQANNSFTYPQFFQNKTALTKAMQHLDAYIENNYLHKHFIDWLHAYAMDPEAQVVMNQYFLGVDDLKTICQHFIQFCFKHNIQLDAAKTLQSFDYHNELSDSAVKNELFKITPKESLNILGFGLDEGHYESSLAQFLIDNKLTKKVNLFGFDPYALRNPNVQYLSVEQLQAKDGPQFDIVTARWVLHHVELQQRWQHLIDAINHSHPDAMVLVVEHGFLSQAHSPLDLRVNYLLNATFDIIANIGLRPRYFTDSAPNIGANFFIHYLTPQDFTAIGDSIKLGATQQRYDVGPGFPTQTIQCWRMRS